MITDWGGFSKMLIHGYGGWGMGDGVGLVMTDANGFSYKSQVFH